MTVAEARTPEGTGNLGNRVFSAILTSILLLFLAGTAMVLVSNIWYIHIARNIEYPQSGESYQTGWQCLVATLKEPQTHFAIRLSVVTAFLTAIISMLVAIPSAYLLSRYRAGRASAGVRVGQYALVVLILGVVAGFRVWRWSWEVVAVAALLCFILVRYRLSLIDVVDTLVDLPIVMPPPVVGISLLFLFSTPAGKLINDLTPQPVVHVVNAFLTFVTGHQIWDDGSTWAYTTRGIVMAQFFVACAFGLRALKATFDTLGTRHEDVARTLGCTRRQAFFKVVLPMAAGGLVAGTVMTWARAIAEFGPVLFFTGSTSMKTEVMPISMFLRYSSSEIEKAVALVVVMITISALTLLTFKKMGGKGYLW